MNKVNEEDKLKSDQVSKPPSSVKVPEEETKKEEIENFVEAESEKVVRHNKALLEKYLPTWLPNARKNTKTINYLIAKGGHEATEVPLKKDLSTIFIIGSGPSLDQHIEELKKASKKHPVIASNSNYSNLVANGIHPDIVMATDSSPEVAGHLHFIMDHNRKKTNLVTTVTVDPATIDAFFPRVYLFKSFFQDGNGGVKTPYNHFLNNLFDNISSFLIQAGCVTNQTLILIDALKNDKRLDNTNQVVLIGCDYSYTDDLYRCMRYKEEKKNEFTLLKPKALKETKEFKEVKRTLLRHQGVLTNPQMLRYKRSLYTIWTYLNLPLFRIGPSILTAVPEITWEDVEAGTEKIHEKVNVKRIRKDIMDYFNLVLSKDGNLEQREEQKEDKEQ